MLTIIGEFFAWHRRHHVTGVEILHFPLLIVSVLLLSAISARPTPSPLIRTMESAMPLWMWGALLLTTAALLMLSLVFNRRQMHRWSLAAAASWWFTATFLVWHIGLTFVSFLSASIYLFIGLSAWWRIAELAMREEADRDE